MSSRDLAGKTLPGFYDRYWTSAAGTIREQVFRDWWQPAYEVVRGWLESSAGGRALIVGCGTGADLQVARQAGLRAVGIDLSRAALERARSVDLVARCPAEALPFRSGAFDVVWIANSLMYTRRREALDEARRVCKPGGVVILLEPMRRPLVVRWMRRLESFARHSTYWEPADLGAFRRSDELAEMRVFFLFSPLWVGLWRRRLPPAWALRLLDAARAVDRALLSGFPFLRRWAYLAAVRYRMLEAPASHCPVCELPMDLGGVWREAAGFRFVPCRCGAASLVPLPLEKLDDHYGDHYWKGGHGYLDYEATREIHCRNFRDALEWILAYLPSNRRGRWLEVGCGPGYFSALAKQRGFEVHAVERSPWAVRRARELLGDAAVREGDASTMGITGETYDVIVLHDVLEHVPTPLAALRNLRECLAADGVLFVDYWDRGSLAARLLRGHWHAIDPPDHLIHYDSRSIQVLTEAAGLHRIARRRRGRRLALGSALAKVFTHGVVGRVPKALAGISLPLNLGDLEQCLLARSGS